MKPLKAPIFLLLLTSMFVVSCEDEDESLDQVEEEQGLHCDCDRIEQKKACSGWNTLATYTVNLYSPSGDCQELNDTTITSGPEGNCVTRINGIGYTIPIGFERFIIDCSE